MDGCIEFSVGSLAAQAEQSIGGTCVVPPSPITSPHASCRAVRDYDSMEVQLACCPPFCSLGFRERGTGKAAAPAPCHSQLNRRRFSVLRPRTLAAGLRTLWFG